MLSCQRTVLLPDWREVVGVVVTERGYGAQAKIGRSTSRTRTTSGCPGRGVAEEGSSRWCLADDRWMSAGSAMIAFITAAPGWEEHA